MKQLADTAGVDGIIAALATDIEALTSDRPGLAFIGIRRRGDVLAQRLAARMGVKDVGSIDITLYRDDLSESGAGAKVGRTDLPFDLNGRDLVLCDDVIMTGRSVLAAIREIVDFGRPRRLRLAVLVARPERELPIQPDHAGLRVAPGPNEKIDVRLKGQDEEDGIWLNTRG